MRRILSVLVIVSSVCLLAGEALPADVGRLRYVAVISVDDKGSGMRQPEAVACNDRSVLVVGDTGKGRLLRYTVDAQDVKPAGEIVVPQLTNPIRLQMNSKDEIFALDGKQRRIARITAAGEFRGYVDAADVPPPSTVVPRSFRIDRNDNIYVLDIFSARVLVLDRDGKYQRHLPFPARYGFLSDLAVDARGGIYLLDSVDAAVYAAPKDAKGFSTLGKSLRGQVSFATSMAIDSRGVLYVVDQNGGGVVLLGQDGSVLGRQLAMGWTDGLLYYPSQMCLNEKGQAFIADRGNSRVQLFSIVR